MVPVVTREGDPASTPQPAHMSHAAPQGRSACTAAVVCPFGNYWCQGKRISMTESLFSLVPGPQLSQAEPVPSSRLNPCLKLQAVWSSPRSTHLSAYAHLRHSATRRKKNQTNISRRGMPFPRHPASSDSPGLMQSESCQLGLLTEQGKPSAREPELPPVTCRISKRSVK